MVFKNGLCNIKNSEPSKILWRTHMNLDKRGFVKDEMQFKILDFLMKMYYSCEVLIV